METKKKVKLFGVNLNFLNCALLLNAKLSVKCSNNQEVREQDKEDIFHLLAIAEKEYSPDVLLNLLTSQARSMLSKVIGSPRPRSHLLLNVSDAYCGSVKRNCF